MLSAQTKYDNQTQTKLNKKLQQSNSDTFTMQRNIQRVGGVGQAHWSPKKSLDWASVV